MEYTSSMARRCSTNKNTFTIGISSVWLHAANFFGNDIAVDPHSEKREDVMSTLVETSRLQQYRFFD